MKALNLLPIQLKSFVFLGTGVAALGYLFTFSMIALIGIPSFMATRNKAKQAEAKVITATLNRSQQAFYEEHNKFASTIADLKRDIRNETENYRYSLTSDDTKSIVKSTSKLGDLKSYTGAVFKIKKKFQGKMK